MIVLTVIFFLLTALILWIVFVPVVFVVDTVHEHYRVSQYGTFKADFFPGQDLMFKLWIFNVPLRIRKRRAMRTPQKPAHPIQRSLEAWRFLIKGFAGSFAIRRLVSHIDLGDFVLNAQLVPVTVLVNRENILFNVNFAGRNDLYVEMEARINKVLWTFIRFLTKK